MSEVLPTRSPLSRAGQRRLSSFLVASAFGLAHRRDHARLAGIRDSGRLRLIQEHKLTTILRANAETEYGREHGFARVTSVRDYQRRVPLTGYEDYLQHVERIGRGTDAVLTADPVTLLEPSSGSTSASKLIPYTRGLRAEFQAGLRPWLYDLYTRYPATRWGRGFWVVTPPVARARRTEGGIPVGFDDDRHYFGTWEAWLLGLVTVGPRDSRTGAGPGGNALGDAGTRAVSDGGTADVTRFYDDTARALLACADLTLVSVWNPSLLLLVLRHIETHADRLLGELATVDRRRAAHVRAHLDRPQGYADIWPNLTVLSCWADASAGRDAARLQSALPQAVLQPKGLLATEGFVSLPLTAAGGPVLSAFSHFFEFEPVRATNAAPGGPSVDGPPCTADALEEGGTYSVVLTTSGGLYRYRLNDLVEVTGKFGALPVLRFLGKQDAVSDLFGEKLNEVFVRGALDTLGLGGGFAMLAPATDRYVLYVDADLLAGGRAASLAGQLDSALRRNFHYDHCRRLGQLRSPRIFATSGDPARGYLEECRRRGQRLGDVKPAALSLRDGWDDVFEGGYP
jgi:hypothetical protein